jgi:hypothetical protein
VFPCKWEGAKNKEYRKISDVSFQEGQYNFVPFRIPDVS